MKEKNLYQCHVFICTNKKAPGKECCADKNAGALREELKVWAREKYGAKVRINAAGCLDFCSRGISTVIYPQGEWHLELKSTDAEELKKAIDAQMSLQNSNN